MRQAGNSSRWWLMAAAVGIVAFVAAWFLLPVREWSAALQDRLAGLGPWGAVLFAIVFVAGVVALVPGSIFTIASGVAYGFWGVPLSIAAATTGATLAFLVGRHLARERVCAWVSRRPRLDAVVRAVNEEGWKVVGLLRLSPLVPFNVENYLFGVTHIPFRQYVAATLVGITPGTFLNVYVGTLGHAGASERGPLQWTFFGVGMAASVALVWLVGRKAKQHMEKR
jgi:uncharacterized membrane protein YdjX (TVP38/TMEM64 family)